MTLLKHQGVLGDLEVPALNITMAKKDKSGELEYLRGVVKQQRSIIKHLKKEVGRSNKRSHQYEDLEDRLSEEYVEEEKVLFTESEKCPSCSKKIEIVDLGIRKLIVCESCGFKKSRKN